jgi:hypothetical protein
LVSGFVSTNTDGFVTKHDWTNWEWGVVFNNGERSCDDSRDQCHSSPVCQPVIQAKMMHLSQQTKDAKDGLSVCEALHTQSNHTKNAQAEQTVLDFIAETEQMFKDLDPDGEWHTHNENMEHIEDMKKSLGMLRQIQIANSRCWEMTNVVSVSVNGAIHGTNEQDDIDSDADEQEDDEGGDGHEGESGTLSGVTNNAEHAQSFPSKDDMRVISVLETWTTDTTISDGPPEEKNHLLAWQNIVEYIWKAHQHTDESSRISE